MWLRMRLFRFIALLCPAVLILIAVAPESISAARRQQAHETRSTQGQSTIAHRSAAKVIGTPDPDVEWRITDQRFVERTINGGRSWRGQQLVAEADLLAGSAPSAKVCWIVGRNGVAYVTKDAQNWTKVPVLRSADLVAVSAKSARSAIVTTADGRQFETNDGGAKWKRVSDSH